MTPHTILARRGRPFYAAVGLLALAGLAGIFVVATNVSSAETTPVPGVAVPSADRAALTSAASSCPTLTGAELAGQVMAESAFSTTAKTSRGGSGIAGLTDAEWLAWRPATDAQRADPAANILALAHYMCDLVGQVRVAEVDGDRWQLALAAFHSGIAGVVAAKGIPPADQSYVDQVGGYAAWYALQPEFGGSSASSAPATVNPIPTPTAPATAPPASPSPTVGPTMTGVNPASTPSTQPAPQPSFTTQTTQPAPPAPPAPPPAPVPTVTTPPTNGALWNEEFHGCLSADRALDGTQLIMTTCDGSMVQHWQPMPDGTIRAAGLCMDAANAGTADWTPVQVANCSGNPAQLFTLDQQQHLYSPYANKCVNINSVPGVGTQITLYSCLSQTNQIFAYRTQ